MYFIHVDSVCIITPHIMHVDSSHIRQTYMNVVVHNHLPFHLLYAFSLIICLPIIAHVVNQAQTKISKV